MSGDLKSLGSNSPRCAIYPFIAISYTFSWQGVDMDFYYVMDLQSFFSFHSWVNLTPLFLFLPLSLVRAFASFHPLLVFSAYSSVNEVFTESPVKMYFSSSLSQPYKYSLCERMQSAWILSRMEVVGDTDHKTQRLSKSFYLCTIIKVSKCFLMPLALNRIINIIKLLIKKKPIHSPIKFILTILLIYDDSIWKINHSRCTMALTA